MRFSLAVLVVAALATASGAFANGSGGVTGAAFFVEGQLYRTVATPTDLSGTGAPAASFDNIYEFGGAQPNVADAAPGVGRYNGGRWMVHALAFNTSYQVTLAAHDANGSGAIDNIAELSSALADPGPAGARDSGIVKRFVCPAIKVPQSGH